MTGIDFAEESPEEKEQQERTEVSDEAARQLEEYFQGKRKTFKLPLKLKGTEFQKLVWDALLTIPYGETRSYSEIACQIGRPKASRAVGMANHRNPVAIVVPCHRVIGKNGSLTGYAGGLDKKETSGSGAEKPMKREQILAWMKREAEEGYKIFLRPFCRRCRKRGFLEYGCQNCGNWRR